MVVYSLAGDTDAYKETTLSTLLPHAFTPKDLKA